MRVSRPYAVCALQHEKVILVGQYASEGEAKRAMRAHPTGHVVLEGELLASHPKLDDAAVRKIEKALRAETHPACALPAEPAAALARAPSEPPPPPPAETPAAQADAPTPAPVPASEEPAPEEPDMRHAEERERTPAELIAAAVARAGSIPLLAGAIGITASALYSARSGSKPLSDGLRAKLEGYLSGETPARDDGDEEEEAEETPDARAARKPAASATKKKAALAQAPAPTSAPEKVRVELDLAAARRLYQIARGEGLNGLALQLGDALLGGAS